MWLWLVNTMTEVSVSPRHALTINWSLTGIPLDYVPYTYWCQTGFRTWSRQDPDGGRSQHRGIKVMPEDPFGRLPHGTSASFIFWLKSFHISMFVYALHDVFLPDYGRRQLKSPSFLCPQGHPNNIFLFLDIASLAPINKLLDMRRNLTCAPTLSYDKGVAYS